MLLFVNLSDEVPTLYIPTDCEAVEEQELEVTVTVYVVAVVGFTHMAAEVIPPGAQLYVPPPKAVSWVLSPLHILSAVNVMLGVG